MHPFMECKSGTMGVGILGNLEGRREDQCMNAERGLGCIVECAKSKLRAISRFIDRLGEICADIEYFLRIQVGCNTINTI